MKTWSYLFLIWASFPNTWAWFLFRYVWRKWSLLKKQFFICFFTLFHLFKTFFFLDWIICFFNKTFIKTSQFTKSFFFSRKSENSLFSLIFIILREFACAIPKRSFKAIFKSSSSFLKPFEHLDFFFLLKILSFLKQSLNFISYTCFQYCKNVSFSQTMSTPLAAPSHLLGNFVWLKDGEIWPTCQISVDFLLTVDTLVLATMLSHKTNKDIRILNQDSANMAKKKHS